MFAAVRGDVADAKEADRTAYTTYGIAARNQLFITVL